MPKAWFVDSFLSGYDLLSTAFSVDIYTVVDDSMAQQLAQSTRLGAMDDIDDDEDDIGVGEGGEDGSTSGKEQAASPPIAVPAHLQDISVPPVSANQAEEDPADSSDATTAINSCEIATLPHEGDSAAYSLLLKLVTLFETDLLEESGSKSCPAEWLPATSAAGQAEEDGDKDDSDANDEGDGFDEGKAADAVGGGGGGLLHGRGNGVVVGLATAVNSLDQLFDLGARSKLACVEDTGSDEKAFGNRLVGLGRCELIDGSDEAKAQWRHPSDEEQYVASIALLTATDKMVSKLDAEKKQQQLLQEQPGDDGAVTAVTSVAPQQQQLQPEPCAAFVAALELLRTPQAQRLTGVTVASTGAVMTINESSTQLLDLPSDGSGDDDEDEGAWEDCDDGDEADDEDDNEEDGQGDDDDEEEDGGNSKRSVKLAAAAAVVASRVVSYPLQARLLSLCSSVSYLAGDAIGAVQCLRGSLAATRNTLALQTLQAKALLSAQEKSVSASAASAAEAADEEKRGLEQRERAAAAARLVLGDTLVKLASLLTDMDELDEVSARVRGSVSARMLP